MRRRVIIRREEVSGLARHIGLDTKRAVIRVGVANRLRSGAAVWWMQILEVSKILLTLSVRAILNGFGFDMIDPLLNF